MIVMTLFNEHLWRVYHLSCIIPNLVEKYKSSCLLPKHSKGWHKHLKYLILYSVTQIIEKVYTGKNENESEKWPTLDSDTISRFHN